LTFAVKGLSLHVQEVVFLIHNIFVNLRDLGYDEIQKNNSQNELVKEPHDVQDVDYGLGRKGFFAVYLPMAHTWILDVTHDPVLKGNDPIAKR